MAPIPVKDKIHRSIGFSNRNTYYRFSSRISMNVEKEKTFEF